MADVLTKEEVRRKKEEGRRKKELLRSDFFV
jgi:hypothetical protein